MLEPLVSEERVCHGNLATQRRVLRQLHVHFRIDPRHDRDIVEPNFDDSCPLIRDSRFLIAMHNVEPEGGWRESATNGEIQTVRAAPSPFWKPGSASPY